MEQVPPQTGHHHVGTLCRLRYRLRQYYIPGTEQRRRLGYGSVAIVNLYATLNDFSLTQAEDEDPDNLKAILEVCQTADQIVYAPGTGKAKAQVFQKRQQQVLNAIRPFESKLSCLCNTDGKARLQHPLSPALKTWVLSPLSVNELIEDPKPAPPAPKKRSMPKVTKKEIAT